MFCLGYDDCINTLPPAEGLEKEGNFKGSESIEFSTAPERGLCCSGLKK